AHVGHLCADLASRGWAAVSLEYRRIGEPGGAWPGTFTDITAALDALPGLADRHGLDLTRVVWMGHSAGGHLALWAATRTANPAALRRPKARPHHIVALAPVSDLVEADRLKLSRPATRERLGGTSHQPPAPHDARSTAPPT